MRIGFTGTQRGMTARQKQVLRRWLNMQPGEEFHHGDCIGADAEAHDIAREAGMKIIIHPPENPAKRAYKVTSFIAKPKPYLDRNRDIVDATEALIAAPGEKQEQLRSGTWSTIRYAKKRRHPVDIIFPDGSISNWRAESSREPELV